MSHRIILAQKNKGSGNPLTVSVIRRWTRPCCWSDASADSLEPAMSVPGGAKAGIKPRPGDRRLSWPVMLLTLAAVTSSSLSAMSLYQLLALRTEVEELRSNACHWRDQQQEPRHRGQNLEEMSNRRVRLTPPDQPDSPLVLPRPRKRRMATAENTVLQPSIQMMADSNRETFSKEFALEPHTAIPWQQGLRRGFALEVENNIMLVREEGFYFVYSQVYYMDHTYAMGHVVIRKKRNVVGDEPQYVILFRCIQNMNPACPYNTCYTGGIVKLEIGDHIELLIPRSAANVSLYGDATFLGAVKLA
ncbi:tumor necrosis factor ligand superfamily member 13B [Lampris incognitus]|uniref:tumor necrosis factor ligand superfamily member 13B n=1 Tax=Lampris incognitus TaxID=2546036 RepID=UPI0024B4C70B|nr:tumor necrosis factor ligand superfamily member 13B [Lampris incognitus]